MLHDLIIPKPCKVSAALITRLLTAANLRVERAFDLQSAKNRVAGCTCPHHGTAQCDCQYIVLLIYDAINTPLTLVLHGYGGWSWMTFADHPYARQDKLKDLVLEVLSHLQ